MNTTTTNIADVDGKPRVVVPAEELDRRRRQRERRALVGSILDEGAEEREAASS